MDIALVVGFLTVAGLLVATPGPDWAFVLGFAFRGQKVFPAVMGLALGYVGLTIVVATGLGAVVNRYPFVLTAVTVVGAAVLLYLGASMLRGAVLDFQAARDRGVREVVVASPVTEGDVVLGSGGAGTATATATIQEAPARPKMSHVLISGALVSGLNPKALLLFIALLPQFIAPQAMLPLALQIVVLGILYIILMSAFYTAMGTVLGRLAAGSTTAMTVISALAGLAMITVAVVMLGQRFWGF